jgi:NTP pyrophosphatase (non-canonical NTP hydrolase)
MSERWSLHRCIEETKLFVSEEREYLFTQIMLGLFGEVGELIEAEDTLRDDSTLISEAKEHVARETCDVLVYVTLYVKYFDCEDTTYNLIPLNLLEEAFPPSLSSNTNFARHLACNVGKLAEYEKKVRRGTREANTLFRKTLMKRIVRDLVSFAKHLSIDLEKTFEEVTEENKKRHTRGHYGKGT